MRAKLLTIATVLALTSIASAQNTTGGGSSSLGGSNTIGGSGGSGSSSQNSMQQSALNGFVDTSFGARNSNSAIASSNPIAAYYANPYAAGVTYGSSGPAFGTAVYNTSRGGAGGASTGSRTTGTSSFGNSGSSSSGITRSGSSGSGSSGFGSTTSGFGLSSSPSGGFGSSGTGGGGANTGLNRGTTGGGTGFGGGTAGFGASGGISQAFSPAAPSGLKTGILYPTVMRFDVNLPAATEVQTNLQSIVARSSSVRTPAGVRVDIDSGVVVLRGTVASDDERRHVENLVRLSPGVRDVRNELAVR